MKLIVQIPCFNEEATLAQTIAGIPRSVAGVDEVQILVVDDGSTDRTAEIAEQCGVDLLVRHKNNLGLARAFSSGLDASLQAGADIIVNTDGDNQYVGSDIPKLIRPVLEHSADIVVGDRQTGSNSNFSLTKRFLQRLGSGVVRRLSGLDVPDAVSGFRAFSRDAALRLNIVTSFSYTIETIIQAGNRQIAVTSVPVATNPPTRHSRLVTSIFGFVTQSVATMLRMYAMYQPLRMFFYMGSALLLLGMIPIARFLIHYVAGDGTGHIQSLTLGGVLLVIGFVTYLIGLLADLVSFNRRLLESTLEKTRRLELMRAVSEDNRPPDQNSS